MALLSGEKGALSKQAYLNEKGNPIALLTDEKRMIFQDSRLWQKSLQPLFLEEQEQLLQDNTISGLAQVVLEERNSLSFLI